VVGRSDLFDVFPRKLAGSAVDKVPQVSGIDKQNLIGTGTVAPVCFVPRQKPEAGRNLRIEEELCRKIDDAVHKSGLDQRLSDITLS